MERPTNANADEWVLFLSEHPDSPEFVAVQIVEALEAAEYFACECAVERMGWDEIHAFQAEMRLGQSVDEDAGGFYIRAIRRLFGLAPRDKVVTYQEAARAMIRGSR